MIQFKIKADDRRILVKRIEELTKSEAKYLYAPTFAYQIGGYTVTKNGELETDEPDINLINQLAEEGLISCESEPVNDITESVIYLCNINITSSLSNCRWFILVF